MKDNKLKFSGIGNDLYWKGCWYDSEKNEFFNILTIGYNDAYWWGEVMPRKTLQEVKGDKGTVRTFKMDFKNNTFEVIEIK